MAASIIIEQESGTYTPRIHRHNGYYAGDFSTPGAARRAAATHSPSVPLSAPPDPTREWHD